MSNDASRSLEYRTGRKLITMFCFWDALLFGLYFIPIIFRFYSCWTSTYREKIHLIWRNARKGSIAEDFEGALLDGLCIVGFAH